MSKNLPIKTKESNIIKSTSSNSLTSRVEVRSVQIREAFPVPAVQNESGALVTVYKDVSDERKIALQLIQQRQHMMFALLAFLILGVSLFLGSYITKSRSVASASSFKGFPVEGTPTATEHYQYDKSCFTGDNGEKICMTRTSQKRD